MKKVLFCASTYSHIKNFHLPYIRYFMEQGYKVHVAAAGKSTTFPQGVLVHDIPFKKSVCSLDNIKALFKLRAIVKDQGFLLLSGHTTLAGMILRCGLFFFGKKRPKSVYTCHGYFFSENTNILKKTIYLSIEKLLASKTDLLMTMNDEDFHSAQKYRLAHGDIINIPGMGLDLTKVSRKRSMLKDWGILPDNIVMIYAAEFSVRKNQKFLIEHLSPVFAEFPQARLLLAGNGKTLLQCKELTVYYQMNKNIIFTGHLNNMWEVLPECHIALSSSKSEGMPFNIMEAMANGLAVCASDIKGHRDLIRDGYNGVLFSLDKPADFINKIRRLMANREKRNEMVEISKEIIHQEYTLEKVLPEIIQAYKKVI